MSFRRILRARDTLGRMFVADASYGGSGLSLGVQPGLTEAMNQAPRREVTRDLVMTGDHHMSSAPQNPAGGTPHESALPQNPAERREVGTSYTMSGNYRTSSVSQASQSGGKASTKGCYAASTMGGAEGIISVDGEASVAGCGCSGGGWSGGEVGATLLLGPDIESGPGVEDEDADGLLQILDEEGTIWGGQWPGARARLPGGGMTCLSGRCGQPTINHPDGSFTNGVVSGASVGAFSASTIAFFAVGGLGLFALLGGYPLAGIGLMGVGLFGGALTEA